MKRRDLICPEGTYFPLLKTSLPYFLQIFDYIVKLPQSMLVTVSEEEQIE